MRYLSRHKLLMVATIFLVIWSFISVFEKPAHAG